MAELPVVVVGAGMAGTAAAFSAANLGARVVVLHDRAGSSALYSGALDLGAWERTEAVGAVPGPWEPALVRLVQALGVYRLFGAGPAETGLVATQAGVVRPAHGADLGLLDLAPLAGRHVGIADIERDDWDAPLLARTLGGSAWAARTKTEFSALPVRALRTGHERRIAPYDFAALHDDASRRASLAEALKGVAERVDAWLLGPWLGLEPETPRELSLLVPVPVGESTSLMGGPAGARFERARDRLLAEKGIDVRRGRLLSVAARGARLSLKLDPSPGDGPSELEARAVVLATGGVGAGGVVFTWASPGVIRGFELPFAAPVTLGLDGEALSGGGSLHGPSLDTVGLGALERVGILCDALGRPVGQNPPETCLAVAGDAVAGRPRTMLGAALAGIVAGTVAAGG